jgi:hypothetical protein
LGNLPLGSNRPWRNADARSNVIGRSGAGEAAHHAAAGLRTGNWRARPATGVPKGVQDAQG